MSTQQDQAMADSIQDALWLSEGWARPSRFEERLPMGMEPDAMADAMIDQEAAELCEFWADDVDGFMPSAQDIADLREALREGSL